MFKRTLIGAVTWLALGAMQAPPSAMQASPLPKPPAPLSLWRLDCGSIAFKDYNAFFSDTLAYKPGPKELVASCYLVKHGARYLLWDTGLETKLVGHPSNTNGNSSSLRRTIVAQLAEIGVKPGQIEMVGISHFHSDHLGQASSFPTAKLLIGAGDLAALRAKPGNPRLQPELLQPWLEGGAAAVGVEGDLDIFKDGRVVMLSTPGHTPGHHSLLIRLASGPLILSGDLWHFGEQVPIDGVPPFNTNRADTLASMDRISKMSRNLGARIVIQHEPGDIAKLPPFPDAAK